ncbi:MAG: HAD family phosphatase [Erysipelotrichaceae bacterium]
MKGIIFDFNGTLFIDGPKHYEAWNKICFQLRGTPLSEYESIHMHGQRNKAIVEMILNKQIDESENEKISQQKEAMYRNLCRKDKGFMKLVDGAENLFNECKEKRIPISIATASIKENVDFFIESFHLYKWFDSDNIYYDDGINKDKCDMFNQCAKAMNLTMLDCLVFEDSISGIEFATQVGAGGIIALCSNETLIEYKKNNAIDACIIDFTQFDLTKWIK